MVFNGSRSIFDLVIVYLYMAPLAGIEPTTNGLTVRYSTAELQGNIWMQRTESHRRSSGYEPNEILLLHSAIKFKQYAKSSDNQIEFEPADSLLQLDIQMLCLQMV